jgi:antitoxin component of MazEF toxin-antitoxin module
LGEQPWPEVAEAVASEVKIAEGDTVEVSVRNGSILIKPSRPSYSLDELVKKITAKNRCGESDWGKPVGCEKW